MSKQIENVEADNDKEILIFDVGAFDFNTLKMRELVKKGIAKPGVVDGTKGYFIDKQWILDQMMLSHQATLGSYKSVFLRSDREMIEKEKRKTSKVLELFAKAVRAYYKKHKGRCQFYISLRAFKKNNFEVVDCDYWVYGVKASLLADLEEVQKSIKKQPNEFITMENWEFPF